MSSGLAAIKVTGLAERIATLKRVQGIAVDLAPEYESASKTVKDLSKPPRRSGALARSGDVQGFPKYGLISYEVIYAPVIHQGWSTRGLGRESGDLRGKKNKDRVTAATAKTGFTAATLRKTSRQATTRTKRGSKSTTRAVRGGPIKPQPWLYQSWDANYAQTMASFEYQLGKRLAAEWD